jgi:hypothetical protein
MFRFFYAQSKIPIYLQVFFILNRLFKRDAFNNHSKIILKIYLR